MSRILILPASFRQNSLNRKLSELAKTILESKGHTVDLADMAEFDTPSYNEEALGGVMPAGAHRLNQRLMDSDAFIIASPEYNGSMPGYLKNTLDWLSRVKPNPLNKLNGMLMSASPSMSGGNMGLWQLRIPLEKLGARVYPAMYSLAVAHKAFTAEGGITDPALSKRFEDVLGDFAELVEMNIQPFSKTPI